MSHGRQSISKLIVQLYNDLYCFGYIAKSIFLHCSYRYVNIIWFCSDWLAMSNSCYNPFIYGIYNVNFNKFA